METKTRYLLHFVHDHLTFRWPEFLALTTKNKCKVNLISKTEHISSRPYILVELGDDTSEESLVKCARESYLIKGLFELWAGPCKTLADLQDVAQQSTYIKNGLYSGPGQSFRFNCESFASKTSQSTKVEWISKMTFLNGFQSRPDLSNPKHVYSIFEMNKKQGIKVISREYYLGRQLTTGNRAVIEKLSLKRRTFIANTTMDPLLSLISANLALVEPNHIIYDPFVGSGGLIVAAAYIGAYVMGADIDWLLLHGQSRPSRKGQISRTQGECVSANLQQYGLADRYLDVLVSDISRLPIKDDVRFDSIISDPPYGIRECSEKIGSKRGLAPKKDKGIRYPSKTNYYMEELLSDLLNMSATNLVIGGRLVYFLPVVRSAENPQDYIPTHPCLSFISSSEQELTTKISRLLVVMEKTREPMIDEIASIPQIIHTMNFRDAYFPP